MPSRTTGRGSTTILLDGVCTESLCTNGHTENYCITQAAGAAAATGCCCSGTCVELSCVIH